MGEFGQWRSGDYESQEVGKQEKSCVVSLPSVSFQAGRHLIRGRLKRTNTRRSLCWEASRPPHIRLRPVWDLRSSGPDLA